MASELCPSTATDQIREWRSIIVLIVFVLANVVVLFPFDINVPIPRWLHRAVLDLLAWLRLTSWRDEARDDDDIEKKKQGWLIFRVPMNMVTGPLIGVLFLLAITAIGRQEVSDGTVGTDNIAPIDIMAFFFTLAYIAISIDASGLIRWLAFKVLQIGGGHGHRLYFYLYSFFFGLSCFIGNDPVILSGTAFLAYMWRVSANIKRPRAWIHAQFAVANMGSAVLVSSNPTNLVLAGAFQIKFLHYTANMIVPVFVTAIVLFPFLLWVIFSKPDLIPSKIDLHELPENYERKQPVNPNIPNARAEEEEFQNTEEGRVMLLEEIMNPFLDWKSAAFGALIMSATLITILGVNAASQRGQENPVFWITLPAAFVMLIWDLSYGWKHREETRRIAALGRIETERRQSIKSLRDVQLGEPVDPPPQFQGGDIEQGSPLAVTKSPESISPAESMSSFDGQHAATLDFTTEKDDKGFPSKQTPHERAVSPLSGRQLEEKPARQRKRNPNQTTVTSLCKSAYKYCQVTFPTSTVVLTHLPYALVPFALCMFVLVQALVNKGWVPVLAHGWAHWVNHTGTVGAIGGMAFLSVVLCNFAGTNIGTTILLSRIIQVWVVIPPANASQQVTQRTFWATVYSMAIGVNFGAFSTALSASLAGLLWRDILHRKFIDVRSVDFARVNLPIIAIAMIVGCSVLIGEVFIFRSQDPYISKCSN